jgi:hypothetical protein
MSRFLIAVTACLALATVSAPDAAVFPECEAEFETTLTGEEQHDAFTKLQFSIEVTTAEPCAEIAFDLIIEVQLPNGQTKRVRKPQHVKLSDGKETCLVEHSISHDLKLLEYETQLIDCKKCSLEE